MPKFKVTIHVFIKDAVLNPAEGPTKVALHKLGFGSISGIKMGNCFIISTEARNTEEAEAVVNEACKKLLANPVTEYFELVETFEVKDAPPMPTAS